MLPVIIGEHESVHIIVNSIVNEEKIDQYKHQTIGKESKENPCLLRKMLDLVLYCEAKKKNLKATTITTSSTEVQMFDVSTIFFNTLIFC